MKTLHLKFPTELHQGSAECVVDFFAVRPEVDTVLLLNSCARGQATAQSDLDMGVLLAHPLPAEQQARLEVDWHQFAQSELTLCAFLEGAPFAKVHLDFIDGTYVPMVWDDGGGPDDFELAIGNHIAYARTLTPIGERFSLLQATWLPFYDVVLRDERLEMVRDACLYDLAHIPFFVARSLYFQAFDRLYKAFREFLQLLFIKHKRYPIAYNKWIYEQVVVQLGLDELYLQLSTILTMGALDGATLIEKGEVLARCVTIWGE